MVLLLRIREINMEAAAEKRMERMFLEIIGKRGLIGVLPWLDEIFNGKVHGNHDPNQAKYNGPNRSVIV
jgi:hypothetical protein